MKKFKSKLKNQGGFTLIEMLIVVAIIAILVAVSIPLVNSSLERAREATDAANERAAKAAAVVKYLTEGAEAVQYRVLIRSLCVLRTAGSSGCSQNTQGMAALSIFDWCSRNAGK